MTDKGWHPEAESQGRLARLDGHPIGGNPFEPATWLWLSWNAGWADADTDPAPPKEPVRT